MARTIAITGGIGSGKSALAQFIRSLGYVVLDADVLSREVLVVPSVVNAIRDLFDEDVFAGPGILRRDRVRELVFASPLLRKSLEAIIHPAIMARFEQVVVDLSRVSPDVWIFYEIPLLFETGRESDFDAVVAVLASDEVRIERLIATRGLSALEFERIAAAQVSNAVRRHGAHVLVDNSGTTEDLCESGFRVLRELQARFARSVS